MTTKKWIIQLFEDKKLDFHGREWDGSINERGIRFAKGDKVFFVPWSSILWVETEEIVSPNPKRPWGDK